MKETKNKTGLLKTLGERSKATTPPFFKKLRTVGLVLAAAGGVLVAAPVTVPVVIVTIGTYVALAGGVIAAVSQVAIPEKEGKKK